MVKRKKIKNFDYLELDLKVLANKYPLFPSRYSFLQTNFPTRLNLTVSEVISVLEISNSEFYERKKKGIKLPDYIQENEKSRIYFPLICVAVFMSKNFVKVYS